MGKEDHTRAKHAAMFVDGQKDVMFKYAFFANVVIMTGIMALGFVGVAHEPFKNETNTTSDSSSRLLRRLEETVKPADLTTTNAEFDKATCEFAFACQMYNAAKPNSTAAADSNKCLKWVDGRADIGYDSFAHTCADFDSLGEMFFLAGLDPHDKLNLNPFANQGPNGKQQSNAFWSVDGFTGKAFSSQVVEFLLESDDMKFAEGKDSYGASLTAYKYADKPTDNCVEFPWDGVMYGCQATYSLDSDFVAGGMVDLEKACSALGDDQFWNKNPWTIACVANSDGEKHASNVISNLRFGFLWCMIASLVMSALWLCIIKACSTIIVKVFFFSIIGSLLLAAVLAWTLSKNAVAAAIPAVLGLGIAFWFFKFGMSRLGFVGENLAVAITIIQSYPKTVVYSLLVCIPQTIWLFIWVMGAVGAYGMMEVNNQKKEALCAQNPGDEKYWLMDKNQKPITCKGVIPPNFVIFILYVSLFWGVKCLSYIVHCTIAGTAGTWWFVGSDQANIVRDSFNRAAPMPGKGESFGSVSKGALMVAVVTALKAMISEKLKKYPVFGAILGVLVRLMEWINKFAFVFVALYGMPFSKAGSACFAMFNDFGVAALVNDVMLDIIIFFACIGIGFTTAAVSAGMGYKAYDFPSNTIDETANAWRDSAKLGGNPWAVDVGLAIDAKTSPRALKMWADCVKPEVSKRMPYCDCIGGQNSTIPSHGEDWVCWPQVSVSLIMFVVGLFVGYGVGKTTMVAVESAYDTIFVCFIEDAEPCKKHHPESHEKMMNAWSQTPEFQKLAAEHPKKDQYIVVGTTADGQMVLQKV
jgi:hypothetical protein